MDARVFSHEVIWIRAAIAHVVPEQLLKKAEHDYMACLIYYIWLLEKFRNPFRVKGEISSLSGAKALSSIVIVGCSVVGLDERPLEVRAREGRKSFGGSALGGLRSCCHCPGSSWRQEAERQAVLQ